MGGQPDAGKYEALVEQLLEIERRTSSLEIDDLTSSFEALNAVLDFLSDPQLVEREATRPLWRLMFALHDRMQGAKPKLFFETPDRKVAKGAPSYTSAVILRSLVNSAFLSLREGGLSKEEASTWLAAELDQSGITQPNGRAVDARTIVRWRAELGGKSPKGSDWVFEKFVQGAPRAFEKAGYQHSQAGAPLDPPKAKMVAQHLVKLIRAAGF
jgi:hypothetical protein